MLIVSGVVLKRTTRGKLALPCSFPGCSRRFYALRTEETHVTLLMRATLRGWGRLAKHVNVLLCPAHAGAAR